MWILGKERNFYLPESPVKQCNEEKGKVYLKRKNQQKGKIETSNIWVIFYCTTVQLLLNIYKKKANAWKWGLVSIEVVSFLCNSTLCKWHRHIKTKICISTLVKMTLRPTIERMWKSFLLLIGSFIWCPYLKFSFWFF